MKKVITFLVSVIVIQFVTAQNNNSPEKILSIKSKGVTLEGTLLSANTKQKLIIIIAGSGPTDRNCNSIAGINCDSYKLLAEDLSKNNIASFRYDKRGIAKSVYKDFKEQDLTFDDYVNDAIEIFQYLKDSSGFTNIYFAGHSEGSLIGMIATQKVKAKGYISIAGAGRPIDVIITEQITKQSPVVGKQIDSLLHALKTNNKLDSVPPYLFSLLRPSIRPYMISWMKYDPATEIKKLKCPVLIFQGSCDIQVKVADAESLSAANKKAKLFIIEGMTHVLKDAEANCNDKNLKTYHDPGLPLNTQFTKEIVSFIQTN